MHRVWILNKKVTNGAYMHDQLSSGLFPTRLGELVVLSTRLYVVYVSTQ